MKNILASATKIVLLLIIVTLCLIMVIASLSILLGAAAVSEKIEVLKMVIAIFGPAVASVLGFYFAYKGETKSSGPDQPYAGK
ncbi:MAG: hypothetical protein WC331_10795 [Candidatus Omnitrophota bacterium]|jgi:hypothetical protein